MTGYYQYKSTIFECDKCLWKGKGKQLTVGEPFNELFEVHCPNCSNNLGHINYPTFDEVLEFGSEKEKKQVREQITFHEGLKKSELKSVDQLPNIEKEGEIIFHLKEKKIKRKDHLVVYADNQEIWSELMFFEYYERYIEIAKILKQKYGSRMTDLLIDDFVPWMYGDCTLSEIRKVKDFRKTLCA